MPRSSSFLADSHGTGPVCLLSSNAEGKWTLSENAIDTLLRIQQPIASVAIVGKYRTGKSYLMNKLANRSFGFGLGSTIQAETKGIWMWPLNHPQNPEQCLLLLDTEGLYDVKKGDPTNDIQLFTFALLLSRCLIFNTVGTIDNALVEELQLVADLSDNVKLKRSNEDNNSIYFSNYFPNLFIVLRDFFLELKINGKEVTLDEYLENSLKPRAGMSRKDQAYNAPRECIRSYFPKRQCLALPRPVTDDTLLRKMEDVTEDMINPDFSKQCQEAVLAIWKAATPMRIDATTINGPGFVHILREYVGAINDGAVPCIESALDTLKENELRRAYETASRDYTEGMNRSLCDKLPIPRQELEERHVKCREHAVVETFRKISVFEDNQKYAKKLEEDIEKEYQRFIIENNEASSAKAKAALKDCFRQLKEEMKDNKFSKKGGYALYMSAKETAVAQYKDIGDIGPMRDQELHHFLTGLQGEEKGLIIADQALTEKEKMTAELQMEINEQREKLRLEQIEREALMHENMRANAEYAERIAKVQQDFEERHTKQIKDHSDAITRCKQEYKAMMDAGLERQAAQQQMIMDQMNRDRQTWIDQNNAKQNEIARYQEKLSNLMEEQTRTQEQHQNTLEEIRQQNNDRRQKELTDIFTSQNQLSRQEAQHQQEVDNLRSQIIDLKVTEPAPSIWTPIVTAAVAAGATMFLGPVAGTMATAAIAAYAKTNDGNAVKVDEKAEN